MNTIEEIVESELDRIVAIAESCGLPDIVKAKDFQSCRCDVSLLRQTMIAMYKMGLEDGWEKYSKAKLGGNS